MTTHDAGRPRHAPPAVLVVGAGPTGLVAAIGLATHGVAVRLVDKKREPSRNSRAVGIQARSLEVFEQLRVADAFLARGRKAVGIDLHTATGPMRIDLFTALEGETGHPFVLLLEQAASERILRERLEALGGRVEWDVEVVGLEPADDGVAVRLAHGDGREERLRPAWVVAADGADSFVRDAADVPFVGRTSEQRFVVADVRAVAGRLDARHVNLNLNRAGFVLLLPLPEGGAYRLVTNFPPGFEDGGREPTFDDVRRATAAIFPGGLRIDDPAWFSVFRIASRRVARFRHGRVCFAGDAAHVHSPVGAQGMNTGIQDAHALAWKLALVVRGVWPGGALEAYHAERAPVARALLATTDRVFRLVDRRAPWAAALRAYGLPYLAKALTSLPLVRTRLARTVAQLAVRYRSSGVVPDDGTGFPSGAPAPGARLPYLWLRRDGTRLSTYAVADYGAHHLFLLPGPDARAAAATTRTAVARELGGIVRTHVLAPDAAPPDLACDAGTLARLAPPTGAAYLVRPDAHIALRHPTIAPEPLTTRLRAYFSASTPQ